MRYVLLFLAILTITLSSCIDGNSDDRCTVYSYYDNGKEREIVCFESDTFTYTEFDPDGDTLSVYVYIALNEKDTISLYSKKYKNNELDEISWSNDNYISSYTISFDDSLTTHQYDVDGYNYYRNYKVFNRTKKHYPTYTPKLTLQNNQISEDSTVFTFSLPLPDSLLDPDLYFMYGFTHFGELPDSDEDLRELFTTIKEVDSFRVINHKEKVISLQVDSNSNYNLIGYIYNSRDHGHHGIKVLNLESSKE